MRLSTSITTVILTITSLVTTLPTATLPATSRSDNNLARRHADESRAIITRYYEDTTLNLDHSTTLHPRTTGVGLTAQPTKTKAELTPDQLKELNKQALDKLFASAIDDDMRDMAANKAYNGEINKIGEDGVDEDGNKNARKLRTTTLSRGNDLLNFIDVLLAKSSKAKSGTGVHELMNAIIYMDRINEAGSKASELSYAQNVFFAALVIAYKYAHDVNYWTSYFNSMVSEYNNHEANAIESQALIALDYKAGISAEEYYARLDTFLKPIRAEILKTKASTASSTANSGTQTQTQTCELPDNVTTSNSAREPATQTKGGFRKGVKKLFCMRKKTS